MTVLVNAAPLVRQQFNYNGAPVANGLLFTYAAGTTTKLVTYTDSSGATPNTNPIVLDENGQCDVWLDVTRNYKFVLSPAGDTDPPSNPYWTRDNIWPISVTPSIMGNVDTGVVNAYAIAVTPPVTSLTPGMIVSLNNILNTNTGASTLNVNGFGVLPIRAPGGNALQGGELVAGYDAIFMLNHAGNAWTLISSTGTSLYVRTYATAPSVFCGNVIEVEDRQQRLYWQTIGTFTGYASPQVGLFHWGSDTTPRPFQELLIGQTIDATQPKYAALLAYLNSAGYVVPSASWAAGTFNFVNLGSNQYKMADMRNQFIRATGTNADTANARAPGSYQPDDFRAHYHGAQVASAAGAGTSAVSWAGTTVANTNYAGGTETRGANTALSPMIFL